MESFVFQGCSGAACALTMHADCRTRESMNPLLREAYQAWLDAQSLFPHIYFDQQVFFLYALHTAYVPGTLATFLETFDHSMYSSLVRKRSSLANKTGDKKESGKNNMAGVAWFCQLKHFMETLPEPVDVSFGTVLVSPEELVDISAHDYHLARKEDRQDKQDKEKNDNDKENVKEFTMIHAPWESDPDAVQGNSSILEGEDWEELEVHRDAWDAWERQTAWMEENGRDIRETLGSNIDF